MQSGARPRRNLDLGVLDALRGLAALYVMLGHASGLLWAGLDGSVGNGERGPAQALAFVMHSLLRWPHEAVLLFFLLSGFCIHYRQARLLRDAHTQHPASPPAWQSLLNMRAYAQRRLRRLYPPLLVALTLTALFDYVGGQLNPSFYAVLTLSPTSAAPVPSHAVLTLVGNLLLQASFAVPAFGTNGPLWSLAFEAWFYILYPALLFASARLGARAMLAAAAVISLAAVVALPASTPPPGDSLAAYQASGTLVWVVLLLMYWLVWALGAFVAEVYAGRVHLPGLRWLAPASGAMLVALIVTLGQFAARPGWWRFYDIAWGAGLAILLAYVLLAMPPKLGAGIERAARLLAPLGDVSYSLYVVHLPWLVLVSAWWLSWHSTLPKGGELAVPGVLSALALAVCCWYFVERHCVSPRKTVPARTAAIVALNQCPAPQTRMQAGVPTP